VPSRIFASDLLAGQVAVVSGGGSGLGRATALELASCGAQVVVCGRRAEPLEQTVSLGESGRCIAVTCDIREQRRVEALVDAVLERHGGVDLLVNNAGGQYLAPAESITAKGFRTVVRLNVEGTLGMARAVAERSMLPRGRGTIVNVTLSPHHGLAGMAHSSAARAAVEGLTAELAAEWGPSGVNVVALAAGHFATDTLPTKYPQVIVNGLAQTVPLQRLGTEEEFAWAVALLASPVGPALSGSVVTIDGARDDHFGPWPPPAATDPSGRPPAEARRP
jgi:NAD(P)-dependent dehydrogenase (short-subunit alcohol dehydrogenase family)